MSDKQNTGENIPTLSGKAEWTMGKNTQALALAPRVAIAYVRQAIFFLNEGMHEESAAVLDKGLAVVPHNETLLMMRRDMETSAALGQRDR